MRDAGYDVVIIGAGPAGLSAALVLGRSRRSALVVDGGPGRNSPAMGVHGLLACDGMTPDALRTAGREQLREYPAVSLREGRVQAVEGECGDFTVGFEDGHSVHARRIVLATGVIEDLPAIAGLAERWGKSVLGCPYCHAWEVRDRPFAVLATEGRQDVLFAAQLTGWSSEVTLCTNGIPLSSEDEAILGERSVRVRTEPVRSVEGPGDAVERVTFRDGEPVACAAVFLHATTRQADPLAGKLGCVVQDDGTVRVDDAGFTGVPGVYAAGDLARRESCPPGMTFVATAAAMGFVAATAVDHGLFREELD
ncbi:NAD(P)/FAD-dependent oxidoreductase [Amycolatopsis sp. NPDC052450]|uniref:NAD(P)/FAD-dependent oxidoreductase n=1 Tax=Amycolatopsis sp. NPDC052450 TaxID=3363937 RepID=UPI0037CC9CB9